MQLIFVTYFFKSNSQASVKILKCKQIYFQLQWKHIFSNLKNRIIFSFLSACFSGSSIFLPISETRSNHSLSDYYAKCSRKIVIRLNQLLIFSLSYSRLTLLLEWTSWKEEKFLYSKKRRWQKSCSSMETFQF